MYTKEDAIKYASPGWKQLVEEMIKKLDKINPDYEFTTIKEKFGALRIDVLVNTKISQMTSSEWGAFDGIVMETERKSGTICEVCGDPGTTETIRGWDQTLCTYHYDIKLTHRLTSGEILQWPKVILVKEK